MWKTVLAGVTALGLAGAGLAFAQATPPADSQQSSSQQSSAERSRRTAEDFAALTEARIAALRAGLKLSTEQEKHWPAVETAIRDFAKQRAARVEARRSAREAQRSGDKPRPDAIERLRRGADAMTSRGTALKQLADAAEPLYQSLDEGQKRRFAMLIRMGRHGHGHGRHWHRRG
jgi:hypothetical protein